METPASVRKSTHKSATCKITSLYCTCTCSKCWAEFVRIQNGCPGKFVFKSSFRKDGMQLWLDLHCGGWHWKSIRSLSWLPHSFSLYPHLSSTPYFWLKCENSTRVTIGIFWEYTMVITQNKNVSGAKESEQHHLKSGFIFAKLLTLQLFKMQKSKQTWDWLFSN